MGRPQTAWHGVRAAGSSAAPHPGDSERRLICAMRETRRWLGVGCRSWHAAPRARAEGKRPLDGAVRFGTAWVDHNQRGTARAFSKLECCASSLVTASAGMPAPHDMRRWFGVGGCSWHVTPRGRTVGERPLIGAVPFCRLWTVYNQRRMGSARSKLECYASSPVTASAGAPVPREARCASLASKTAACTSHHKRVTNESGLSLAHCASVGRKPITTSAAWHERAASPSASPSP